MIMKIAGIIPARWASTRFPGKSLVIINGKSMIRRVYEQAMLCSGLSAIMVATDDDRIAEEVKSFGGSFMMTSPNHPSGTDRCLEALDKCGSRYDAVVNIQGDEPYVNPDHIQLLADAVSKPGSQIATLVCPIEDKGDLFNPNVVKAVVGQNGFALYFSRQPLPYLRDHVADQWIGLHTFYRHIGMYAYAADALRSIAQLAVSPLEKAEMLEQLRWLENGYRIEVAVADKAPVGVDTPEDVNILQNFID